MLRKLVRGRLLAVLLMAAGCGTALASTVTYDLVGVTTSGGASLTGSFVYDSALDSVLSVNFHETADPVYGTSATIFTHLGVAGGLYHFGLIDQLVVDDGVNTLVMNLGSNLGGLGSYTIGQTGAAGSSYIYVAALFVPGSGAPYNIINGSFAAAQIPEPASIGLVAIALLGAAAGRRHKTR